MSWHKIAVSNHQMVRLMLKCAVEEEGINPAHLEIRNEAIAPGNMDGAAKSLWLQLPSDPGDGQGTIMIRHQAVERWQEYFDGFVRGFRSASEYIIDSMAKSLGDV